MLWKLQRTTINSIQVISYSVTLFIGLSVFLVFIQIYYDTQPLLNKQSDVLKKQYVTINKNLSFFKTINKERIYFTTHEISDIKEQKFIKDIALFENSNFQVSAFIPKSRNFPGFYTDLFFESVPFKYIDVLPEKWAWDSSKNFIPIVIPESYLYLYNFGFAESQGLPVFSKNTISQIEFNIQISGNNLSKIFDSKIIGLSNRINSILVPKDFLQWANILYGQNDTSKINRILIEFKDPSDNTITEYFNSKNYHISQNRLEFSKLLFFYRSILMFGFCTAIVIISLSIALIILGLSATIYKNKSQILNLYYIGYNHREIAFYNQLIISIVTLVAIIGSIMLCNLIRKYYLAILENYFEMYLPNTFVWYIGLSLCVLIILLYNILVIRRIKKTIMP